MGRKKHHPHLTTLPILALEPMPQARVLVAGCAVPEDGAELRTHTKDTNTEGNATQCVVTKPDQGPGKLTSTPRLTWAQP